jgi:predicted dehydrogenase
MKKIHYSKKFGKITKLHIHISHSSAYKDIWRNEWRLRVKSGLGPLETTGIHYIDFAQINLGKITKINLNNSSQLNLKNELDTSDVYFIAGKIICNFRFSYAESHKIYLLAIFKNGYAEYNGKKFNIYYPMKKFNNKQKSISPNLFSTENINFYKHWKESNEKSIKHFFSTVLKNKKFYNFDQDLKVMKPFLYNK